MGQGKNPMPHFKEVLSNTMKHFIVLITQNGQAMQRTIAVITDSLWVVVAMQLLFELCNKSVG